MITAYLWAGILQLCVVTTHPNDREDMMTMCIPEVKYIEYPTYDEDAWLEICIERYEEPWR